MPMQPSTQVTHIPEDGVTESSVLFFVRVAADEFVLDSVVNMVSWSLLYCIQLSSWRFSWGSLYLTGHTGLHVAHHVLERALLKARGA
jgi:hypothetical protein